MRGCRIGPHCRESVVGRTAPIDGRHQRRPMRGTSSPTDDINEGRRLQRTTSPTDDINRRTSSEEAMVVAAVQMTATERLRNYIGGKWVDASGVGSEPLYNPATGEVIAAVPLSDASDVERAVQAAGAAFDAWRETPVLRRARIMFRYKELLEEHKEELAAIITREHGKTLAEARAELERGIE